MITYIVGNLFNPMKSQSSNRLLLVFILALTPFTINAQTLADTDAPVPSERPEVTPALPPAPGKDARTDRPGKHVGPPKERERDALTPEQRLEQRKKRQQEASEFQKKKEVDRPKDKRPALTPEEREARKQAIDTNKDGVISPEEREAFRNKVKEQRSNKVEPDVVKPAKE